jgi:hypothetical protein
MLARFWYLVLAVTATAGLGAALLAQGVINARSDAALEDGLRRDRMEMEALLRLEARARLDRIAFITVDGKVGGILRRADGVADDAKLREMNTELKEALRGHVARMAEAAPGPETAEEKRRTVEPNIALALDADGRIIAQLGPLEANPPGAGLGTFPLVRRALQGYVRDDVWVYDRRVYRMAARPVMAGVDYAGAIVHGYAYDDEFVRKLSEKLGGTTLAFFHGTTLLAGHSPTDVQGAPQTAELAAMLPTVLKDAKFLAGERTDTITLQSGGHTVFAPIVGSAAQAGVGYAIARPRTLLASPDQVFKQASTDDVRKLPYPMLGGGALVLAVLGMFFLWVERDRHVTSLAKRTGEIASGERDRLVIGDWRGAFRALADQINRAIDKECERAAKGGAAARKKKAGLDEILGAEGTSGGASPFFGFAGGSPSEPGSAPGSSPNLPRAPSPAAPPAPAAPQSSPRIRPPTPPGAPPPVPSGGPSGAPAEHAGNGAAFDEDAHWHEVYEQYVATRQECGEAVESMTFEKFEVTLKKTRDQILAKPDVAAVRFSVYVKEGKAALRAQPVKK